MFPPVDYADEHGLLCYGGELNTPILLEAYRNGIFPWPHEGYPLLWFAPPFRGILFCEDLKISRRARRAIRAANFSMRIDQDFEAVVRGCGGPRSYSDGTWVNEEIIAAYCQLHRLGLAHSIETYQDGELVGGLYGLSIGKYFCGESMFHTTSDASKAALIFLVEYLQQRGATWIDCQLNNPFFEAIGAVDVPRDIFTTMLENAWYEKDGLFGE